MKKNEIAFLAQVALGWFSVDPEGRIWRHVRFAGGGATSLQEIPTRRAERSRHRAGSYLRVLFRDGMGLRRKIAAHRAVWMLSSRRMIPIGMEINHINGDRTDNRPGNLEMTTHRENAVHSVRVLGNKPKARLGTTNAAARLSESDIPTIRRLAASGEMSQREIGCLYGVSQKTVSGILHRKTWTHVV